MDLYQTVESIAGATSALIAASSLVVSLIAFRIAKEQARSYLFPVPAIFADPTDRCIAMRNFGTGAMLDISTHVELSSPGLPPLSVDRTFATLGSSERVQVVGPVVLANTAVSNAHIRLEYRNIKGEVRRQSFDLEASQLSALDGL